MRIILKILAAPVAVLLALVSALCSFALVMSGMVLALVSTAVFIFALTAFWGMDVQMGAAWTAVAFLISPYGLPKLAQCLLGKLVSANRLLTGFIFG